MGYQLLEPISLTEIIANPSQAGFAVALMEWVSSQFVTDFPTLSNKVSLHVVAVTAHGGTYPAFGVKYKIVDSEDLSVEIEAAVDSIIQKNTVSKMLLYFANSAPDWNQAWQTLKSERKGTS